MITCENKDDKSINHLRKIFRVHHNKKKLIKVNSHVDMYIRYGHVNEYIIQFILLKSLLINFKFQKVKYTLY